MVWFDKLKIALVLTNNAERGGNHKNECKDKFRARAKVRSIKYRPRDPDLRPSVKVNWHQQKYMYVLIYQNHTFTSHHIASHHARNHTKLCTRLITLGPERGNPTYQGY